MARGRYRVRHDTVQYGALLNGYEKRYSRQDERISLEHGCMYEIMKTYLGWLQKVKVVSMGYIFSRCGQDPT